MRKRKRRRSFYQRYLRSLRWKRKRDAVVKRDGGRCRICNAEGPLEVHHRTYKDLGHEKMADLISLCPDCHEIHHKAAKLRKNKKNA